LKPCSPPSRRIPIRIPAVDPGSLAFSLPLHRAGLRAALYCLALFAIAACGSGDGSNSAPLHVVEGVRALEVVGAAANTEAWVEDAGGNRVTSGITDGSGNWSATVAPGRGYRVVVSGPFLTQQSASVDAFALAGFDVRESVEQLHVTGATVDSELEVRDDQGELIDSGTVDAQGAYVARALDPALNLYRVIDRAAGVASADVAVMSPEESLPDPSFYSDQTLVAGLNYITMRDGTTLSAYVTFPAGPGPYPTLVSYSGYAPSKPGESLGLGFFFELLYCPSIPTLCDAPNHPAGVIGGLFGFATVGVNMRGTGCSGGAYDFFEPLQVLDGYDVIEAVANQEWVLHNHVGMTGLSYPGISQLFTAQTQPPGLAAITPLSVIANTAASTLAPGGIFNDGFALDWAETVFNQAAPYGQGWELDQVAVEAAEGVTTCADNQQLHGQAVDPLVRADNEYYDPEIADALNPSLFVDKIDVPVFLTGSWQDEQTGPHFATLLDDFDTAPVQRFVLFNGLHADGYSPKTVAEWKAFLDIYVAERAPIPPSNYNALAPLLFEEAFGQSLPAAQIPFSDRTAYPTLDDARTAYEAQPRVEVIFERGSNPSRLGMPTDGFSMTFSAWPPPETELRRLYLHEDGSLREVASTTPSESASKFEYDPEEGVRTFGGQPPLFQNWLVEPCGADTAPVNTPPCQLDLLPSASGWAQPAAGKALVFESDPLTEDHVFVGSGSVDLWLKSNAVDADLEVLISEVRPDGNESYVQAGWLRASQRALAPEATPLQPVKTHLEADAAPLPGDEYELVRVEIMPFAQVFRAGSRVRLEIGTPGDSRELWEFILLEFDTDDPVEHQVAHSLAYPSSIALPLIPAATVPEATVPMSLPPCPGLRAQPCRMHVSYSNTPGD